MITSARRAALSCALLATTAFCGLSAQPAAAQASQTPSIYKNIDANGVDLTDGSFNFQLMEGSIGSGSGALALMRYHGAGGQLNSLSVRFSRVVTSGTASITLTFGDRALTLPGHWAIRLKRRYSPLWTSWPAGNARRSEAA